MSKVITSGLMVVVLLGSLAFAASDARPVDEQRKIIVREKKDVSLGVVVRDAGPELLKKWKLPGGAEIVEVLEESEAEKIGLADHDIITRFDGQPVDSAAQLRKLVDDLKEKKTVKIVVNRRGENKTFQAKLEPKETGEITVRLDGSDFDFDIDLDGLKNLPRVFMHKPLFAGSRKGGYLGVSAQNMTDQLRHYFEVENGVLVEKVIPDSPAEKAGLKAGDVILKVGDKTVKDYADLVRFLNYYDPGTEAEIEYSRKGKKKQVQVELGEKRMPKMPGKWMENFEPMMDLPEKMQQKIEFRLDELDSLKLDMKELKDDLKDLDIDLRMYVL